MRIALDRRYLLGFQSGSADLDVPVVAAKVGNKPTIGITVASASGRTLTDRPIATDDVRLTYPAPTVR